MSLHDRIMALPVFNTGAEVTRLQAANRAKETDDLIDWCEAHFETLRQLADSAASFDEAKIALDRIKKFKEQTK